MSSGESKSNTDYDISALRRKRDMHRNRVSDFRKYIHDLIGSLEESNHGDGPELESPKDLNNKRYEQIVTNPDSGPPNMKNESDVEKFLEEIEGVRLSMNHSQALRARKPPDASEGISYSDTLAEDTYSFIELIPYSLAAALAWSIFFVQLSTYFLSIGEALPASFPLFGSASGDDLQPSTPLNIPRGNDIKVQMAQAITIFIIPFVQDSLRDAITHFFDGYGVGLRGSGITYTWWFIANLLRLVEGLIGTLVLIVLISRSENVVDLLKDFTAMTFISTLDELAFQLGSKKFAGSKLKAACDRVLDFEVYVPPDNKEIPTCLPAKCRWNSGVYNKDGVRKKEINVRYIILMIIMVILYIVWLAVVVIPQQSQKYLCQSIYVQFSDDINQHMAHFSGYYDLQLGKNRRSGVTYMERRSLDQRRTQPMVLRFCKESSSWVLALSNDSERSKECTEDFILLQSEYTSDSQHYNIMDISTEDWSALNIDERMMPMDNFFLECRDANNEEDYDTNVTSCKEIERDDTPPFKDFISTKYWRSNYAVAQDVLVYDHSVYTSSFVDDDIDMVFFTGNRWVITSTLTLFEKPDNVTGGNEERRQAILTYLENDFHAYWSNYTVDFFSEPVSMQTPKDKMSPEGLRWYSTKMAANLIEKQKSTSRLAADQTNYIPSIFICKYCNNRTNPCYFGNICPASSQICNCVTGSSGTLCQKPPTQNGFCDDYFNNLEYQFDGGDCCINKCISGKKKCGVDKLNKYYVGYHKCKTQSSGGYLKTEKPLLFADKSISNIHVSANGRVFGVMADGTYAVQIFDRDGSEWVPRGSEISADVPRKVFKISSQNDAINGAYFAPVSVAISGISRVSVYDWDVSLEVWTNKFNIPFNASSEVNDLHLCNEGKSLGILRKNGSFVLFERLSYFTEWTNDPISFPRSDYKFFSMSDNGKTLLLATSNHIYVFSIEHRRASLEKDMSVPKSLVFVKMSSNGHFFALIEKMEGLLGQLRVFSLRNGDISDGNTTSVRGININDDLFTVSPTDFEVVLASSQQQKITFYTWIEEDGLWSIFVADEISKKSIESADTSISIKIAVKDEVDKGYNSAIYFYTKVTQLERYSEKNIAEVAESNFVNFHFTLGLDENPSEIRWEILRNNKGDRQNIILRRGGPYDTGKVTVLNSISVDKTDCIGVKIIDLGLDGLKQPAYAGVTIDGKLEWFVPGTNGYEDIFLVSGDEECSDRISDDHPWKRFNISLHKQCQEIECKWTKIGTNLTGSQTSSKLFLRAPLSLSADGSIIAISHHDEFSDEDRTVKIFRYNEDSIEKWEQLGGFISKTALGQIHIVKSVELSADGFTVAIDFISERNESYDGSVNVFKYDEVKEVWNQVGGDIHGGYEADMSGKSVTLSADGNIIALATASNGTQCTVHLFRFEEDQQKWGKMGECLGSGETNTAFTVQISSTGFVVAIGFPFAELRGQKTGQVKVFEFVGESWKQRGTVIEYALPSQQMGRSISISSDGSILAVGGTIDSPIQVLEFHSAINEWRKLGNDIINSMTDDIKGYFTVSLSSDGSVLVVSIISEVQVYIYDNIYQKWIQSMHKLSTVENQSKYEIQWLPIVSSADVLTVAIKSADSVNVLRLSQFEQNGCRDDERLFNFTITPDRHPGEISWKLIEKNGREILGGELKSLLEDSQSKVLVYTKCLLISDSTYYSFLLEDSFGDGICCDWNKGNFELKWEDELFINNINFKKELVAFLPPSVPTNEFELLIINDSDLNSLSWILRNSHDRRLFQGHVGKNGDIRRILDIPKNDCYTFALYNSDSNLTAYYFEISWGGKIIVNRKRQKMVETIVVGQCSPISCKDGFDLFYLDLLTNASPEDISWHLKDPSDTSIAQSSLFTIPSHYYHDAMCIPDNACLSLHVLNYNVSAGSVFYDVYLNGEIVVNIEQDDKKKEIQLKKSCTGLTCDSASTTLRFHFQTDYFPEEFSWKLDVGNAISGDDYHLIHFHYFYEICISVDKCTKLELNDSKGDGGTKIWLNYLNVTYQIDSTTKYTNKEIGIFCD